MNKWLKQSLQTLKPYHAKYLTEGIKLDANESAYPILEGLKIHMEKWVKEMAINRYPDTDSHKLKDLIAENYEVNSNQVVCGVGSDQLIDCILRGVLEQGECVLAPHPSFSMYPLVTQLNGGVYQAVPLNSDFSYNAKLLIETVEAYQPKVIFLCNPNNPTGSILILEELKQILDVAKGLVVVDEAYGEYMEFTAIDLIDYYPQLVVLKTFSKAYALAGARVGYAIGHPEIIEMIETIKPPYNLNSFSEEIASWVMTHQKAFLPFIQETKKQRELLRKNLLAMGYQVYPSSANFLWIETDQSLETSLQEKGVYIRPIHFEGKLYYRITVGTEAENEYLISRLREEQV